MFQYGDDDEAQLWSAHGLEKRKLSHPHAIKFGVPQESISGPVLFLTYIIHQNPQTVFFNIIYVCFLKRKSL